MLMFICFIQGFWIGCKICINEMTGPWGDHLTPNSIRSERVFFNLMCSKMNISFYCFYLLLFSITLAIFFCILLISRMVMQTYSTQIWMSPMIRFLEQMHHMSVRLIFTTTWVVILEVKWGFQLIDNPKILIYFFI